MVAQVFSGEVPFFFGKAIALAGGLCVLVALGLAIVWPAGQRRSARLLAAVAIVTLVASGVGGFLLVGFLSDFDPREMVFVGGTCTLLLAMTPFAANYILRPHALNVWLRDALVHVRADEIPQARRDLKKVARVFGRRLPPVRSLLDRLEEGPEQRRRLADAVEGQLPRWRVDLERRHRIVWAMLTFLMLAGIAWRLVAALVAALGPAQP